MYLKRAARSGRIIECSPKFNRPLPDSKFEPLPMYDYASFITEGGGINDKVGVVSAVELVMDMDKDGALRCEVNNINVTIEQVAAA
jgi:hypothetical protein